MVIARRDRYRDRIPHLDTIQDFQMQYFADLNGRAVQATYELANNEITISNVKVMTSGTWKEQTGEAFNNIRQWMIAEYEDEMMSSW